jgi:serine/threonine-protein kinase
MEIDDAADLIGRTIANRYRVERLIAQGSAGPVLAAHQLDERREVCLKIVRSERLADQRTLARFAREAKLIARLTHPNIVSFYSHGTTASGDFYLAMELVPGRTLDAWLQRGPMSWGTALGIMVDLLSALQAAHAMGVVHRDIKHGNVMFVRQAQRRYAKLLDFGIAGLTRDSEFAHEVDTQRSARLTESGVVVGTPGYIAPEVLLDREFDTRADLYALGVVWWELLAGHRVFSGERMPMLIKHMTERAPTLSSVGVKPPPGFEDLIMRMLEKDADKRPESAVDVLETITALDFEQGLETETHVEAMFHDTTKLEPLMTVPTTDVPSAFVELLSDSADE